MATQFADDEAPQSELVALDVLGVDPVVANLRIGHRDDLTAIRWVGQDLLIARHAGVEDDFAEELARSSESGSGKDGAVGESKFGRLGHGSGGRESGVGETARK